MTFLRTLVAACAVLLCAATALAYQFKVGDLVIEQPWSRATPTGAAVAAGYLVIHNNGDAPDKLTGGSADFSGAVEVHEMTMDNGVMKMRKLVAGLEIPAHGGVTLDPNHFHLMFTQLKRQLKEGETVKADLTFEHAGTVSVMFTVGAVGAMSAGGDTDSGGSMPGMKM